MKSHSIKACFGASKEEIGQRAEGPSGGLGLDSPQRWIAIQGDASFFLGNGYKNSAFLCGNDPQGFQESIAAAFGKPVAQSTPQQTALKKMLPHKTTSFCL